MGLYTGTAKDLEADLVFASVQTLGRVARLGVAALRNPSQEVPGKHDGDARPPEEPHTKQEDPLSTGLLFGCGGRI